jgi:hypothetical protein
LGKQTEAGNVAEGFFHHCSEGLTGTGAFIVNRDKSKKKAFLLVTRYDSLVTCHSIQGMCQILSERKADV